jgi:two-component system LytT family response regulator
VALRDELEAVRCVVALENARLGDRIELRVQVPEDLLQALLPGSSLLPLFEMLLDEPPDCGATTVEIAARRRDDRLEVELRFRDATGPARPRPALEGERAARLAAVQQRLQRLPGGRVDLVSDNGATGARLVVPLRAPDTAASPDAADSGAAAPDAAEPGLDLVEADAMPEPTLPWALLLGAAPLFTLVAASVPVLAEQALGRAFPWSSLGWGLLDSLSVTALVPAVVHAAILYPVESPRRAHNLLVLVSVALACATLPQVLSMSVFPGTMPEGASRSLAAIVPRALDSRGGLLNILFYAAIGLGVLAFGWGRKASERAAGAARLRARLAEMRLQVLRMQIHPHFLFNTLNAIAGLLGVDAGAARRMTAELQEFLRLCLGQEARQTVALRDELHFLETYVRIEEARFGDRLQVDLDVDPAVLDAEVPSLILQPLVENAVRHGIAPRREGGRVEVRARDEAGVLHLRVADSGAGRDPARRLREGVGLSNTRARLRQLYGARQSLEIGCAPGRRLRGRRPPADRAPGRTGGQPTMIVRTLLVDDEPLSRQRLRNLLQGDVEIDLVGECGDGQEAVEACQRLRPDLVLLDVQMPGLDGFEVLDRLDPQALPAVVFVTAYGSYAVKAFEVHALDYLVKPVVASRLAKALERVKSSLIGRDDGEARRRLTALVEERRLQPRRVNRFVVKVGGRFLWKEIDAIDYIEADGNYVRVHLGKESRLVREKMNVVEQRLDAAVFLRVHRSYIVNVGRVKEIFPMARGEYRILLQDGVTQIPLSRGYRQRLEFQLGEL